MNWDDIINKRFENKQEKATGFTLESLMEEIDRVSEFLAENKQLNEKQDSSSSKKRQQLLSLFKLQMSENWGKADTVERQELARIVRTATAGQNDVQGRLRVMQEQMSKLREGTLGKIQNPRRILSQIILLETFNRLFKSFQASPAGFINEGLLSVFYGSFQEEAGEANKVFQIGDVIDPDGTPISIKTKTDKKPEVDGSIKNLYVSLNNSPTKKVYFDIFIKKGSEGDSEDVGSLTFYRFTVDATNINEFLNKDLFEPHPKKRGEVVLKPEYRKTFLAADVVQEGKGDKLKAPQIYDVIAQFSQTGEVSDIDEEELRRLFDVDDLGSLLKKATVTGDARGYAESMPSDEGKRMFLRLIGQMTKLYNAKFRERKDTGHDPKTEKIHTDFSLGKPEWMRFALAEGNLEDPIVLNFSDADIEATIQAAVKDIDEAITDMFNTLSMFTETVQEYLTTIASNRAMIGMRATQEANELPEKTEKVVAVASSDPDLEKA